ncbi:hypothetical protein [uncultured Tateyamaria sp.]|uniref:hypothetical protein n=1 Tax=uncultured Tateyamaria sp. TaxID=455651 RepID=UPI0026036829|nr:hypothetical protein [uncultured Tateyamaria sp.]
MRNAAVDHALRARAVKPTLIPVSDAVLRMFPHDPRIGDPAQELHTVMMRDPNWGSLLRAMPLLGRRGDEVLSALCKIYGPLVKHDITAKCEIYTQAYYGTGYGVDYAVRPGYDPDDLTLVIARAHALVNAYPAARLTTAQVDWLEETLLTFDGDVYQFMQMFDIAGRFSQKISHVHSRHAITRRFKKAHLAEAEVFLEKDPYNAKLMHIVQGVAFQPDFEVVHDSNVGVRVVDKKPEVRDLAEERARELGRQLQLLEFMGRRLILTPLAGSACADYAIQMSYADDNRYIFEVEAAFENAIAYADRPSIMLDMYLGHKEGQAEFYAFRDHEDLQETWDQIGEINYASHVLCPTLRAYLLRQAICPKDDRVQHLCPAGPSYDEERVAAMLDEARATPQCKRIVSADPVDLMYFPVPVRQAIIGWE